MGGEVHEVTVSFSLRHSQLLLSVVFSGGEAILRKVTSLYEKGRPSVTAEVKKNTRCVGLGRAGEGGWVREVSGDAGSHSSSELLLSRE